jgi:hypothetical protein
MADTTVSVLRDRAIDEWTTVLCRWLPNPDGVRESVRISVAATFDALGLVAIDPALVEAVKAAPVAADATGYGESEHSGICSGSGAVCERCEAKLALADHVIAQLGGG